ncbi:MAG: general secretion pathway protein GspL [Burkholderiaceae bacterium]|nr:general secretion pathway protein GspL [Burkholderiaceae bacterium]
MSLLLLTLPPGAPGGYEYATSVDGRSVARYGHADAALLPPAGRGVEVVAVVPAALLSWQRVRLPRGIGPGSPRLRAVLAGLLEDRLLDAPEQLHFALDPDAAADGPAWVAVCDKTWLAAHLHALDAAERPVGRIVPELYPRTGVLRLIVTGQPERPWVLMSGDGVPDGAQALPLTPGALALLHDSQATPDDGIRKPPRSPASHGAPPPEGAAGDDGPAIELLAEPAVAAQAEQIFNRRVVLCPPAERLLMAGRSPWDLAQLDLARTGAARAARRAAALWRDFLYAPLWRPARWGLALLLLAHLIGLNVWAWRTQQELAARRAQIVATLTKTFPQVKTVIDAPAQMAREIATLRQSTGAASARDLEPMLGALGQYAPEVAPAAASGAVEFAAGELRVKGVQLPASALAEANQRLRPQGYQLQTDADGVLLRLEASP